mmetsp:Transcript_110257/g.154719  ORF Transcript_110257/g.154719 Transcript_110257/m.154719 type:complete len:190 (+) Transcript_110257:75-644(+)
MVATLEEAENGTAAPAVVRGIPIKAGPGIVGAQVGSHLRPPAVSVPATILDMDEQVVLNYQMAVYCFAFLDTISTVFNIVGVYAAGLQVHVWQLVFLLLLLGPLCGLVGASRLKRSLVLIFVVSSAIKALIQVGYALYSGNLWTILFAFLQCWITKVGGTFWWYLGNLSKERRRKVLEVKDFDTQRVYW